MAFLGGETSLCPGARPQSAAPLPPVLTALHVPLEAVPAPSNTQSCCGQRFPQLLEEQKTTKLLGFLELKSALPTEGTLLFAALHSSKKEEWSTTKPFGFEALCTSMEKYWAAARVQQPDILLSIGGGHCFNWCLPL